MTAVHPDIDPESTRLQTLIREQIRKLRRSQPDKIANAVVQQIPPRELAAHLEIALRPLVADVMRLDRNEAIATLRRNRKYTQSTVSANVEAIRSVDWERIFRSRAATPNGWKQVGECTADDLEYCADERRRQAELTLQQAEFYEELAQRIRKAGVNIARELEPEDLPS